MRCWSVSPANPPIDPLRDSNILRLPPYETPFFALRKVTNREGGVAIRW